MARLKHPTIPGIEREVEADQVDDWKDSGWLDIRAKGPEAHAESASKEA